MLMVGWLLSGFWKEILLCANHEAVPVVATVQSWVEPCSGLVMKGMLLG